MNAKKNDYIEAAKQILVSLGFPRGQQNDRSALALLALLDLSPGKPWGEAESPLLGITPIMSWMAEHYGKAYKPNSREGVRRRTLHQFCDAGLALYNPDKANRPVNSNEAAYRIDCIGPATHLRHTAMARQPRRLPGRA